MAFDGVEDAQLLFDCRRDPVRSQIPEAARSLRLQQGDERGLDIGLVRGIDHAGTLPIAARPASPSAASASLRHHARCHGTARMPGRSVIGAGTLQASTARALGPASSSHFASDSAWRGVGVAVDLISMP